MATVTIHTDTLEEYTTLLDNAIAAPDVELISNDEQTKTLTFDVVLTN